MTVGELTPAQAAEALKGGHVVAVPTETFYGLAADIRQPEAVAAVFEMKGRTPDRPSPVLVRSVEAALALVQTSPGEQAMELVRRFWPGGLTIVLEGVIEGLPRQVRTETTIAVRQDGDHLLREAMALAGCDVTGTSANRSGEPPLKLGASVSTSLRHPLYAGHLGGEETPGMAPSTIVSFGEAGLTVLRPGTVSAEALELALRTS